MTLLTSKVSSFGRILANVAAQVKPQSAKSNLPGPPDPMGHPRAHDRFGQRHLELQVHFQTCLKPSEVNSPISSANKAQSDPFLHDVSKHQEPPPPLPLVGLVTYSLGRFELTWRSTCIRTYLHLQPSSYSFFSSLSMQGHTHLFSFLSI